MVRPNVKLLNGKTEPMPLLTLYLLNPAWLRFCFSVLFWYLMPALPLFGAPLDKAAWFIYQNRTDLEIIAYVIYMTPVKMSEGLENSTH